MNPLAIGGSVVVTAAIILVTIIKILKRSHQEKHNLEPDIESRDIHEKRTSSVATECHDEQESSMLLKRAKADGTCIGP